MQKCTPLYGSSAQAGSEARPGAERRRQAAAGRRPVASTGQNSVLPAHSGLRPPFTTAEQVLNVRSLRNRAAGRRPAASLTAAGQAAACRKRRISDRKIGAGCGHKCRAAAPRARLPVPRGGNRGRNDRAETATREELTAYGGRLRGPSDSSERARARNPSVMGPAIWRGGKLEGRPAALQG